MATSTIDDQYHTITEKVADDIKEALSVSSPTGDASLNSLSASSKQNKDENEHSSSSLENHKKHRHHQKTNSFSLSFETPQRDAEQESLSHLMSSEEFSGNQFNDLSSIEIELGRKISMTSSSEDASSSDKEKDLTEIVGKKPKKKKSSKNALNETQSSIKSNASSCYSIWNDLTKTLTGNKRPHQQDASDLLTNSRPASQ